LYIHLVPDKNKTGDLMEHRVAGEIGFITGKWPLDSHRPTLVFIHGAGASLRLWESQVEALSPYANTMAIDLPGHGTSHGKGRDSISDYARVVNTFLDLAQVTKPIPCGLSMGGAITQNLLINTPGRFPAGILINTGARLKVLPMIFETIGKSYDEYVELSGAFAVSPKNITEELTRRVVSCLRSTSEVVLGDFQACDAFDVMGQLGLINVPVLVLTASDDILTPPKYGSYLAGNLKDAHSVNIENAGHFSPIEKPIELNNAIHDFLIRLAL
jgi:pimeloyl-ACP methyl ester carboxylesterase